MFVIENKFTIFEKTNNVTIMIRIIDLEKQISEYEQKHFAFIDSNTKQFLTFNGNQVWVSKRDFENDYDGNNIGEFINLIDKYSTYA